MLKISGLKVPVKRFRLADGIGNKTHISVVHKKFKFKDKYSK